ncbi:hypothetical protein [Novosphingobium sp. ST904]|uniref:hypothetical protein n=1 Tax=Novosphingobium sp. ST904 TaxID=1684385 RepID=UPI0006C8C502|nr:hypothetical protein [Novosphingobium sp. ST904]KPH67082.1 hypothetical protein ADT71_03005 [Novosphingobium sp. ST904]TCM25144.1 hypothetical protein EDF59_1446 [Novosphingobium sp. ST904]
MVQAFARHRREVRAEALEEAAKVASNYQGALKPAADWGKAEAIWYETGVLDAALSIATALRARTGQSTPHTGEE